MKSRDYEEFIVALNDHHARYLIVGAHAVAYHARPRATKDFDILIERTPDNASRVLAALKSFLGADLGYTVDDLGDPDTFIQLGVAPVRIDLMSSIKGCGNFALLWKRRVEAVFGSLKRQRKRLRGGVPKASASGLTRRHDSGSSKSAGLKRSRPSYRPTNRNPLATLDRRLSKGERSEL